MLKIDEQLTGHGFRCIANFDNMELIDKIDRQIPDIQGYDYRIIPFYIAHGISYEDATETQRQSHSIYSRESEQSEIETSEIPLSEDLTGHGFEQVAIFSNHDMIDRIKRSMPDIQEYDFRIIPFCLAHGIKQDDATSLDIRMYVIYVRRDQEDETVSTPDKNVQE